MSDHPHNKSFSLPWSLCFKWNFLSFHLCRYPLVLSLDIVEKTLAPFSLTPHQVSRHIGKGAPEPSLLQVGQFHLFLLFVCQMFHALNHLCGPFLGPLQYAYILYWEAQHWTQMHLTSAELNKKLTSLDLPATIFLMQSKTPLAFFVFYFYFYLLPQKHCWLMFHLVFTSIPRSFAAFQPLGLQHMPGETPLQV